MSATQCPLALGRSNGETGPPSTAGHECYSHPAGQEYDSSLSAYSRSEIWHETCLFPMLTENKERSCCDRGHPQSFTEGQHRHTWPGRIAALGCAAKRRLKWLSYKFVWRIKECPAWAWCFGARVVKTLTSEVCSDPLKA